MKKPAFHSVCAAPGVVFGSGRLVLIAGPCVLEPGDVALKTASALLKITRRLKVPFVFKCSFDKANRSSVASFRGPGLEEGLSELLRIKRRLGVPLLTDVHQPSDAAAVARVADILQIPAFLCRQTDLLLACARTGRTVNVKKGQFLSPQETLNIVRKVESCRNRRILLTERGTSFGYNNLVNDFRAVPIMRGFGYPVVFDATHSVQNPGGLLDRTGGQREFVPTLARAAVAAGADAVFLEVHPDPDKACSDGPNMLPLKEVEPLLKTLLKIKKAVS